MKALAFDENILTNIEKIDEQHKHLISVINSFLKAIDDKLPIPELERALDQIIFYSSFHFSHEEELMGEYNCPLINLAKQQHQSFILNLNMLKYKLRALGITSETIQEIELLIEQMINHIITLDTKIQGCHCQNKSKK